MLLTASPFHPTTGDLLPVYRDAYLRGDLSRQNMAAVDAYLQKNRELGHDALGRFHALAQAGDAVRPVGWVGRQLELMRTEPKRFRQRAAALVVGAALIAGASMAATSHGSDGRVPVTASAVGENLTSESAASTRMVIVRGRILDENGHPLVGATVLHKGLGRGVGTDADGNYAFAVPANQASELQFGYAGYTDENVPLQGHYVQNVTLLPRKFMEPAAKQRRRWLFF